MIQTSRRVQITSFCIESSSFCLKIHRTSVFLSVRNIEFLETISREINTKKKVYYIFYLLTLYHRIPSFNDLGRNFSETTGGKRETAGASYPFPTMSSTNSITSIAFDLLDADPKWCLSG